MPNEYIYNYMYAYLSIIFFKCQIDNLGKASKCHFQTTLVLTQHFKTWRIVISCDSFEKERRYLTLKVFHFLLCIRFLKMRSFSHKVLPLLRQIFFNDKAPCTYITIFLFIIKTLFH